MPLVIIRSHNVTHIAQTPTTRGSRIGQRDVRVSGMATLKDRIDAICKELKVAVKEGGLIAQVIGPVCPVPLTVRGSLASRPPKWGSDRSGR